MLIRFISLKIFRSVVILLVFIPSLFFDNFSIDKYKFIGPLFEFGRQPKVNKKNWRMKIIKKGTKLSAFFREIWWKWRPVKFLKLVRLTFQALLPNESLNPSYIATILISECYLITNNIAKILDKYLAHVIKQPNFRIPNPQYLQWNFCFDFFNDSENTFWGFFEI